MVYTETMYAQDKANEPTDFNRLTGIANWLNVGSIACTALLLLSLLVLPVQKTSRHYLTVCLLIAVGFMSVGVSATQKCRASANILSLHS